MIDQWIDWSILLQLRVSGSQHWMWLSWNWSIVDLAAVQQTCCWQTGVIPTPQWRCWCHICWELDCVTPLKNSEASVCYLYIHCFIIITFIVHMNVTWT